MLPNYVVKQKERFPCWFPLIRECWKRVYSLLPVGVDFQLPTWSPLMSCQVLLHYLYITVKVVTLHTTPEGREHNGSWIFSLPMSDIFLQLSGRHIVERAWFFLGENQHLYPLCFSYNLHDLRPLFNINRTQFPPS